MKLFDELETRRAKEQLIAEVFAQQLGISRATYYAMKDGRRRPSDKFRTSVIQRYPELAPIVLDNVVEYAALSEAIA